MTGLAFSADELCALADIACDGALTEQDLAQLEQLLHGNTKAQQYYLTHVCLDGWLRWEFAHQSHEPATPQPAPILDFLSTTLHNSIGYFSSGWPVAYLVATMILGIGMLIGAVIHVSQPVQVVRQSIPLPSPLSPLPSAVGRITGMVDCQWADESTAAFAGAYVPLGRRYALASGLMEITYDTGAKVILQGPVTYEVESAAGGYLSLGKLTARLEKGSGVRGQGSEETHLKSEIRNLKSEISGPWPLTPGPFAIRTPTATVTDLGTEFGVEVSKEGQTTSHVFRGSVRLVADKGHGQSVAQVLHENQSAQVDGSGSARITVLDSSAKPAAFVRAMPKRIIKTLDLVDVVAGGDGFSGRRNRGIDPSSGRIVDALRIGDPETPYTPLSGDGQYHRVAGMPLVDGVFIPDGAKEEVQVDSAGHMFAEFQGTANKTWQSIWAGGAIPVSHLATKLGGVDYASPGHGHVFLHASNAVTFDLEAIRRANPGCKVLRFRAAAANAESGGDYEKGADVWVLVDGESRFELRQIVGADGVFPVLVPISDKDRFLTLAATDGGNGIAHDWIIFGDPRLELLGVETKEQKGTEGH